jgi:hypothetical protein
MDYVHIFASWTVFTSLQDGLCSHLCKMDYVHIFARWTMFTSLQDGLCSGGHTINPLRLRVSFIAHGCRYLQDGLLLALQSLVDLSLLYFQKLVNRTFFMGWDS